MSLCGEPIAPLMPMRAVSSTPHNLRTSSEARFRHGHVRVISPNNSSDGKKKNNISSGGKLTFTAQRTSKLFELLTRPALLFTPSLGIYLPFLTISGQDAALVPTKAASPPRRVKRNQPLDPDPCLISVDGLVDCLFAVSSLVDHVYCDFVDSDENQDAAGCDKSPAIVATSYFLKRIKPALSRLADLRLKLSDFKIGSCIGRGACGIVSVVRELAPPHSVYAMKSQFKGAWLHHDPEGAQIMLERTVLAQAAAIENPWLPHLHYAFQDDKKLHLVMDYEPGGDLYIFLSKAGHLLESSMIQFYAAEAVEAVHSLHKMGYIHCDLKPENFAIERSGHLKLLDFGSAIRLDADGKCVCPTMVGTKEYLNIELLRQRGRHNEAPLLVGPEYDYWAIGVLLYEMFYGQTPFYDEDDDTMMSKIVDYKRTLKFPSGVNIPDSAVRLICSLITSPGRRLTYDDLVHHPFFKDVDFATLRESQPPYMPPVREIDDVANFTGGAVRPRDENILNMSTNETFSPARSGGVSMSASLAGRGTSANDSQATVLMAISPNRGDARKRSAEAGGRPASSQGEAVEANYDQVENIDPEFVPAGEANESSKTAKLKAIYEAAAVVTHEEVEEIEDIEWEGADCVRSLPFIGYTFTPGLVLLRHLTSGQAAAVLAAAGSSGRTPYRRGRTLGMSLGTSELGTPHLGRSRRDACLSQDHREHSANVVELERHNQALQKQIDLLRAQHESQSEELRKRLVISLDNSRVFSEINDAVSQLSGSIMDNGKTALEHLSCRVKQLYDENTHLQTLNRTSHQNMVAINRVRSTLAQLSALPSTVTETDLVELLTSLYPPVAPTSTSITADTGDCDRQTGSSDAGNPLPDVIGHELVNQLIGFAVKQYKLATERGSAERAGLEAEKEELRQALTSSRSQVTQLVGTLDRMFADQQQSKVGELALHRELEALKQRLDDAKQLHRDLREKCNRYEDKYYLAWDKLKEEEKKSVSLSKRVEVLEESQAVTAKTVATTVQTDSQNSVADLKQVEGQLEESRQALQEANTMHAAEVRHLKDQVDNQKAELSRLLDSEKSDSLEQSKLLQRVADAEDELRALRSQLDSAQSENRRLVATAAVEAQRLSDVQLQFREACMNKDATESLLREANLKLDRFQNTEDNLTIISQLQRELDASKAQLRIAEQDRVSSVKCEASLGARIVDLERELASARHDHDELFDRYNRMKESTVELEAMITSGDGADGELSALHRQLATSNVERRALLDEVKQLKSEVERLRVNNSQLVRQRDHAVQESRETTMTLTMEKELSEVAQQSFDRELHHLTTMNKQQGKLINHMYSLLGPEQRSLPLSSLSDAAATTGCSMLSTPGGAAGFKADRLLGRLPMGSSLRQPSTTGLGGPLVSAASAFFSKRREKPSSGLPKQPSRLRRIIDKSRFTFKRRNELHGKSGGQQQPGLLDYCPDDQEESGQPVDSDLYTTDDDIFEVEDAVVGDEDLTLADFESIGEADGYHNLPRMVPAGRRNPCEDNLPRVLGEGGGAVAAPHRESIASSVTSSAPSTASSLPVSSVSTDGYRTAVGRPVKSSWRSTKQRRQHVGWADKAGPIAGDTEPLESVIHSQRKRKSQPKLLKQLSRVLGKGKSSSTSGSSSYAPPTEGDHRQHHQQQDTS